MGPFDTEREARELPEVRAIYEAARATSGPRALDEGSRLLLGQALEAAGVELGAYDERIAEWLAGWEPHVVAVIAGWVSRARAASSSGKRHAGNGAARDEDQAQTAACEHCGGTGYCTRRACDRCAAWQTVTESSECGACRGTSVRLTGSAR